jgi:ribonuclease D
LIPDSSIVAVAKDTPKTKPELAGFKGFAGRASRTYLDTWWKAIQQGGTTLDLPPLRLPATGIPNHRIWPQRFPEADARLKLSKISISSLSEEHSIPIENLLTPDYLRNICFDPPVPLDLDQMQLKLSSFGARPWQVSLTAELLLQAFNEAEESILGKEEVLEPNTEGNLES